MRMLLFGIAPQVSVDNLLQKAETMFPEGIGAPKAFACGVDLRLTSPMGCSRTANSVLAE